MRALPAPNAPRDPARPSAVERLAADRARFSRGRGSGRDPASKDCGPGDHRDSASEPRGPGAPGGGQHPSAPAPVLRVPAPGSRRAVARRPLRPDSLVIYRQKCDFVRCPGPEGSRASLVKRLFPGPGRDRASEPPATPRLGGTARTTPGSATPEVPGSSRTPAAPATPGSSRTPAAPATPGSSRTPAAAATPGSSRTPAAPATPGSSRTPAAPASPARPAPLGGPSNRARTSSPRAARRAGLQRSHSSLSPRGGDPGAERDAFFQFCGLDPDVVEALGRDNFSAGSDRAALKVRSVSVATSDGGFSRRSGGDDDGLQEEALTEQVPSTTSIIERNARIIKWLYTCRKAKESPGQGLQGPA